MSKERKILELRIRMNELQVLSRCISNGELSELAETNIRRAFSNRFNELKKKLKELQNDETEV